MPQVSAHARTCGSSSLVKNSSSRRDYLNVFGRPSDLLMAQPNAPVSTKTILDYLKQLCHRPLPLSLHSEEQVEATLQPTRITNIYPTKYPLSVNTGGVHTTGHASIVCIPTFRDDKDRTCSTYPTHTACRNLCVLRSARKPPAGPHCLKQLHTHCETPSSLHGHCPHWDNPTSHST
jgi:hypothetical protein